MIKHDKRSTKPKKYNIWKVPFKTRHLLSNVIFSVIFLVLMLSSWFDTNTSPLACSFQPYLLIHAVTCVSNETKPNGSTVEQMT